jgi:cytochrome P450
MPSPASASRDPAGPRFAVNSYSTPHNSVYDDIEQTAAIGGAAVGLWEGKFGDGDDQKIADFMAEHGIAASFCVPRVHSILGIPFDRPGTPKDPGERTELICASVHRLAEFAPAVIAIAPGTSGDPARPAGPVEAVAEHLPAIADAAAEHGVVEAAIDPEPWLSLARAEQPVFYLPGQDVWCVTRYADIREVLRNPATYSSRYANKFRPMTSAGLREVYPNGHPGLHSMLLRDPPEHSRVRRLANTAFTPKMVAALEPRIRARCHALIDAFIADGHCELVAQYSSELTVGTMMDISGAPQTLGEEFARWGQDYFALTAGAPPLTAEQERDLVARARRMTAWLHDSVQARRAAQADDFISALITATTGEGDPALSYDEVVGVLNSMMVAGVETTAIFIPTLVRELIARPGLRQQVVADPSILPAVVDEGLRIWPPARGVRRTTTREVELGGVTIPAGADVFVLYVSANFDETVFEDPGRFDPGRRNAERHLSFGKGVHFCIGAPLARAETVQAVAALFERIPGLRLAGDDVEEWLPHMTLPRRKTLRLEWR